MAPSLEEPIEQVDEALDSALKAKPNLVAPEPGTCVVLRTALGVFTDTSQNTVLVPSLNRQAKEMPAKDVRTKQYAHPLPKDPIQIFPS